ncbi:hypothetical protein V6N13_028174 [Hibiscus sabdariffa]
MDNLLLRILQGLDCPLLSALHLSSLHYTATGASLDSDSRHLLNLHHPTWSFAQPSSLVLSLSSCLNQRFILCKLDSPCYDIVSGIINIPIPMAA